MVNNTYKENLFGGQFSMEELWNESSVEAGPKSYRELVRLGTRIDSAEKKRRCFRILISAIAVAAALAVATLATYSIARRNYAKSPLEYTRNLVAEYGQTTSVTLSDGTVVHLNSGSTLLYPEQFTDGKRIVFLTGEANFNVAQDPSRPFIVKSSHMDVKALGTEFCVHSYAGEKTVSTTLSAGKVEVTIPSMNKSYILEPDNQIVFSPSDKEVSFARVDAKKILGWEDGYLTFSNASFPEIASVLERRFNMSINYNAENMKSNALNVRFMPGESLDDVLGVLVLLIPGSSYKKDADRIYWRF